MMVDNQQGHAAKEQTSAQRMNEIENLLVMLEEKTFNEKDMKRLEVLSKFSNVLYCKFAMLMFSFLMSYCM